MKILDIDYVKIHPKAKAPEKLGGNLAFDLSVVRDDMFFHWTYPGKPDAYKFHLLPNQRHIFHTGLKIAIPFGYGVLLRDRSGMAAKYGIHVLAGVIDSSYRGEWMVCLFNTSDKRYCVTEGDRIVQAIIVPEFKIDFNENKKLDDTFRGEKGFGSSGK